VEETHHLSAEANANLKTAQETAARCSQAIKDHSIVLELTEGSDMEVDEVSNDLEDYQEEDPDAAAGTAGPQDPSGTKSHKPESSRT
jgi:hypothetical protein